MERAINKTILLKTSFICFAIAYLFSACTKINLYQSYTTIPDSNWYDTHAATGSVNITDTSNPYKVYVLIRHTDAYNYNNMWLNIGLQMPQDTFQYKKINIPLGSDAQGWYGTGIDDIWDAEYLISSTPIKFSKPGMYNFKINQIMRDNPLKNVLSVGLKLEKYTSTP